MPAPNVTGMSNVTNHFTNVLANVKYLIGTVNSTTNLTPATNKPTAILQPNAASVPAHAQGAGNLPLSIEKKSTNNYNLYLELAEEMTTPGDFDIVLTSHTGNSTNVTTVLGAAYIIEIHFGFNMVVQKVAKLSASADATTETLLATGTEANPVPFVFYTNWDAANGYMLDVTLSGGKAPYTCHILDNHVGGQAGEHFAVVANGANFRIQRSDNSSIPSGKTFTIIAQDSAGRVENQSFTAFVPTAPTFTLTKAGTATVATDTDISANPAVWAKGTDDLFTMTVSGSDYTSTAAAFAVSAGAVTLTTNKAGDVLTVTDALAVDAAQQVGTTSLVYTEVFGGLSTAFDMFQTTETVFLNAAVTYSGLTLTDLAQLGHYRALAGLSAEFQNSVGGAALTAILTSQVPTSQVYWTTQYGLGSPSAYAVALTNSSIDINGTATALTLAEGNVTGPSGTQAAGGSLPNGVLPTAAGSAWTVLLTITDASGASLNATPSVNVFPDMSITVGAGGLPTYLNRQLNSTVNLDISGYFAGGAAPYTITGGSAQSNDLSAIPVAGAASIGITGTTFVITDSVGNSLTVGSGSTNTAAIPASVYAPQSGYEAVDSAAANGETRIASWSPATVYSQPSNLTAGAAKTQADQSKLIVTAASIGHGTVSYNNNSWQIDNTPWFGNYDLALSLSIANPGVYFVYGNQGAQWSEVQYVVNGQNGSTFKDHQLNYALAEGGLDQSAGTTNGVPIITGTAFAAAAAGDVLAVKQNAAASDWYYATCIGNSGNQFQMEWLTTAAPWWNTGAIAVDSNIYFYLWSRVSNTASAVVPATAQAAFQANTFSYARLPVSLASSFSGGFPLVNNTFNRSYTVKAGLKHGATDVTENQTVGRSLLIAETNAYKLTLSGDQTQGNVTDAADVEGYSYTFTVTVSPFTYTASNDGLYTQQGFVVDNSITFASLGWVFDGTSSLIGQDGAVQANTITNLINDFIPGDIIGAGWTDCDVSSARSWFGNLANDAGLSMGVSGTGNVRLSAVTGLVSAAPANSYAAGAVNGASDIKFRTTTGGFQTEHAEVLGTYDGVGSITMSNVCVTLNTAVTAQADLAYDANDIAFAGADDGSSPGFVLRLDLENLTPGGSQQKLLQMALLSLGNIENTSLSFNLSSTYIDSVTLTPTFNVAGNGQVGNVDWQLYQRTADQSSTDINAWTLFMNGSNESLASVTAKLTNLPQRVWAGVMASATEPGWAGSQWYLYRLAMRNTAEAGAYSYSSWFNVAPGADKPMAVTLNNAEVSYKNITLANGNASYRRGASNMDSSKVALMHRQAKTESLIAGAWSYATVATQDV